MAFVDTNSEDSSSSGKKRLIAASIMSTMVTLLDVCAKQATRVSKKLNKMTTPSKPSRKLRAKPKQLLNMISNKAMTLVQYHKKQNKNSEEPWGDGGVWQRSILMGDKCQPLDFSGVIYYDNNGKRLNELPHRSPRASPLPGYLERAM